MSLFRYSGLTTKVRAMSGRLLKQEDFEQLSSLDSVPLVITWLKKKPSYAGILGKENENDLHRGQAEGIIMQSLFSDFSKLYRFSDLDQRTFLDGYFRRYEITCLKMIVRSVWGGSTILEDISDYREVFSRHSSFPLVQAASANSIESLIMTLEGTPYGRVLKNVYQGGEKKLFDYEFALDMFYFTDLWKKVRKNLRKQDSEAVILSVGTQIDLLNLQWIYRAKKYYGMAASDIYALIIPVHYRISVEQIRRMAEAGSIEEMMAAAGMTKYGKYLKKEEIPNLEEMGKRMQEKVHTALLGQKPYSAACLDVYLYRKEREVHRIITAMECVRYGLPADKIREYLA